MSRAAIVSFYTHFPIHIAVPGRETWKIVRPQARTKENLFPVLLPPFVAADPDCDACTDYENKASQHMLQPKGRRKRRKRSVDRRSKRRSIRFSTFLRDSFICLPEPVRFLITFDAIDRRSTTIERQAIVRWIIRKSPRQCPLLAAGVACVFLCRIPRKQ